VQHLVALHDLVQKPWPQGGVLREQAHLPRICQAELEAEVLNVDRPRLRRAAEPALPGLEPDNLFGPSAHVGAGPQGSRRRAIDEALPEALQSPAVADVEELVAIHRG
jgi:hypothetical protein